MDLQKPKKSKNKKQVGLENKSQDQVPRPKRKYVKRKQKLANENQTEKEHSTQLQQRMVTSVNNGVSMQQQLRAQQPTVQIPQQQAQQQVQQQVQQPMVQIPEQQVHQQVQQQVQQPMVQILQQQVHQQVQQQVQQPMVQIPQQQVHQMQPVPIQMQQQVQLQQQAVAQQHMLPSFSSMFNSIGNNNITGFPGLSSQVNNGSSNIAYNGMSSASFPTQQMQPTIIGTQLYNQQQQQPQPSQQQPQRYAYYNPNVYSNVAYYPQPTQVPQQVQVQQLQPFAQVAQPVFKQESQSSMVSNRQSFSQQPPSIVVQNNMISQQNASNSNGSTTTLSNDTRSNSRLSSTVSDDSRRSSMQHGAVVVSNDHNTDVGNNPSKSPTSGKPLVKAVCPVCYKEFDRKSWLERHLSCHNDLRTYRCAWCSSRHKRKDNLLQHLKSKHPVELIKVLHEQMILNGYSEQNIIKFGKRTTVLCSVFENQTQDPAAPSDTETATQPNTLNKTDLNLDSINYGLKSYLNPNKIIRTLVNEGTLSKDLLRLVLNTLVLKKTEYTDDLYHVS